MFTHLPQPQLEDLKVSYANGSRFYRTPTGECYPSVTSVLQDYNKEGLIEWRAKVGVEVADKIAKQAGVRGNAIHNICENYLKNDPDFLKDQMPVNVITFNSIKPTIDKYVNNIHCLEAPLYSDYLKTAGRVDCIAEFDGVLSVIDFKTSLKTKKREWIKSYFMQTSAYAVMYEERTGIPISRCVVIISVDFEKPQIFVEKRNDNIEDFIKQRLAYDGVKT